MPISLETLIPEIRQKDNFLRPDSILKNFSNAPALKVGAFAQYDTKTDTIFLPKGIHKPYYYYLLYHELAHSLVHPTRLNLNCSGKFKSYPYVLEELTAELTATIICAKTGLFHQTSQLHTTYINAWYKVLFKYRKRSAKNDLKNCIKKAYERTEIILK
ncbi:zincin-like metallopeptidase domain-containing protein [Tenacibaculum sp. TC6]|uniref:zincin-like metallopeptidase domain-containing protein n=1 Tax=Tenacibaculum sp. TC6 TaxID=3423223 RepID=UPI003D35A71E